MSETDTPRSTRAAGAGAPGTPTDAAHAAPDPAGPTAELPEIRLRPGQDAGALRHGAPWAWADQIAMDRRTRKLPPGSIVRLLDDARQPLGVFAFNPISRIAARLLDRDPDAVIGAEWLSRRIARALELREHLFDAPFYRLVHAEADGLPGVIIDRFGDAAVVQPNAAWAEARAGEIANVLAEAGMPTVLLNGRGRARAAEGLDDRTELLRGTLSGPIEVPMNGAVYLADLEAGQKTGLFYDQRSNHAFAARLARGREVLDVFSHVGGFGLAALAAGARAALAVDGSAPALALARQGAERMGAGDRFETRKGDAFAVMDALAAEGRRFGIVVCDPPAFAPSRQALGQGLRAYERVAQLGARLVAPGGYLVLCSCSHAASLPKFRASSLRGVGRAGRQAQILHQGAAGPDHPSHPHLDESGYLKAIFLRLVE